MPEYEGLSSSRCGLWAQQYVSYNNKDNPLTFLRYCACLIIYYYYFIIFVLRYYELFSHQAPIENTYVSLCCK
jgi:hypothetical protein